MIDKKTSKLEPSQTNPDTEEPRIGVYTCYCGGNIGFVIDCELVAEELGKLPNVVVSRTDMSMCSDIGQTNIVTLTVTDDNGNQDQCTSTVTVEDNVAPDAVCQDLTIQLDPTGNASITPQDVDNGSTDACGIASLSLDNSSFNCSNVNAVTAGPSPTDLFISEYVEGSLRSDKAVEIFNGTGAAIDLAAGGYAIDLYFNGSATAGQTINLSGTVADGV